MLLPVQEIRELVGVQRGVRLIPRHERLQESEAVPVDRPDVQAPEAVARCRAQLHRRALADALLQLGGRLVGEGEGDDRLGWLSLIEERRDPLCDDLGLTRASSGDDLYVSATVSDGVGCLAFEYRNVRIALGHATASVCRSGPRFRKAETDELEPEGSR